MLNMDIMKIEEHIELLQKQKIYLRFLLHILQIIIHNALLVVVLMFLNLEF